MRVLIRLISLITLAGLALGQSTTSAGEEAVNGTSSTSSGGSSAASTTGTSRPNSTSNGQKPTVQLPNLITCQAATISFSNTDVGVQKSIGFYVEPPDFLEIFTLPDQYNNISSGTFQWYCDLPVGLTVSAMFYYFIDGRQVSASTPSVTVGAGTSTNCLAGNSGQNTHSILSYASSLDPLFTYRPTSTGRDSINSGSSSNGTNVGAIVGGVVAAIIVIVIIIAVLIFFQRRKSQNGQSVYGGQSEKYGPSAAGGSVYGHYAAPTNQEILGNYIPYDEYGRPLVGGTAQPPSSPPAGGSFPVMPPVPQRPPGFLPEPMDADDRRYTTSAPSESDRQSPLSQPQIASYKIVGVGSQEHLNQNHSPFDPIPERRDLDNSPHQIVELDMANDFAGTKGLDDPSSFSPNRYR